MQNLSLAVDQKFQILHTRLDVNDVRVAKLEEIVLSGNVASGGQVVMQEIESLKAEIQSLKSKPSESKDATDRSKTAIFGGFSSFKDL